MHSDESNDLTQLDLDLDVEGDWQPIELTSTAPPFRAFACSALMCQHAYLRMNASERDLVIDQAIGEFWLKTTDWLVTEVTAHFKLIMRSGEPSADDLSFISERMRDCPISRNLNAAHKVTTIEVDSDD